MWHPPAPAGTMAVPNTVTQPIINQTRISGLPGTIYGSNGVDPNAQNFRGLYDPTTQMQHSNTTGEYRVNAGFPHVTQGLPFLLQGRAKVLSSDVMMWTTESDPIRVIFGTEYTDVPYYILHERELIQAPALVTPERVLAKTPSIEYRSFHVRMRRIALDCTINTNGAMEPEALAREIEFKMSGNKNSIQAAILHCAYEAVLKHGVDLAQALKESSHVYPHLSDVQRIRRADADYARNICGALHMPHGVTNLLMNLRKSSVYTPSGDSRQPMEVAILPNLLGAVEKTKPEKMTYSISGIAFDDMHETMELEKTGYTNADWGNISVLPYVPPPTSSHKIDELTDVFSIGQYYIEKEGGASLNLTSAQDNEHNMPCIITDFQEHAWTKLPRASLAYCTDGTNLVSPTTAHTELFGVPAATDIRYSDTIVHPEKFNKSVLSIFPEDKNTPEDKKKAEELANYYVWWSRPCMTIVGQSGIFCAEPGSKTACILIAKPSTKVVEAGAVDEARIMTRLMIGSIVKQPQKIIIMKNIKFAGIVSGAGRRTLTKGKYDKSLHDLVLFITKSHPGSAELWDEQLFIDQCNDYSIYTAHTKKDKKTRYTEPVILYSGTVRSNDHRIRYENNGHLKRTDHPNNVGVIEGNQAYIDIVAEYRSQH